MAEKYGAWGEKSFYGVKSVGIIRSTFLIDEKGQVIDAWRKVKAAEHTDWVVETLGG